MNKVIAIALLFVASPSHAETTSITAPNGAQILRTKCSSNPDECYQEARQTCRGNYQILDSESHAGGLIADIMPGPVTWYSIQYQCGRSDGRMATFPHKGESWNPPRLQTNDCYYNGYDNDGNINGNINCAGVY